ncbi:serine hydrolase domain-containing protein [Sphingomonas qomolangmaensis]|uniref:Beta-lactamase family protein n=1 Tax=Sphingomonas qomolangmaensis TaxID=2918765 RepID=A0ABY5L7X6_9SPHN|nr:serine hydrolase [Sphingomonas qomolangmaensis]UUL82046.1 beta-lactamase family protein [Sphingomonas qomolangmaensis]
MSLRIALLSLPLVACSPAPSAPAEQEAPATTAAAPSPRTTGLDPALLAQTVAAAQRLPRIRSLLVLRDGETLAEHRFNGGPPLDRAVNIKSASKTILSALAGIAIDKGVLEGADQPILPLLRADAPANPDPRLAQVTVDHLLSMRAGLDRTSGPNYGAWVASPNWVRYALGRRFVDEPGGGMLYSTGSSHLLSAALTRASGRSTHQLATQWLGEPLGISIPQWPRDAQGVYFGGNDMLLSPRALARFGEMYRNGGRVGTAQVVPAAWIDASWQPRATSPWSGNGYGYGWFVEEVRGHPVRFAWGYGGQMLYVLPSLGLTVVMTSDPSPQPRDDHVDSLHGLLAEGIIPAAIRGAG